MDVLPYEGVIIETPAAQIYGVWGMGIERSGVLRLLVTDPSERVEADQIDARSAYAILIGGSCISAAALRRAVQEQVRGVIVGGIEEHELRTFLNWAGPASWHTGNSGWQLPAERAGVDAGLTLLITEGFGVHPMSSPCFDLLTSLDRQEALVEGVTELRQPLRRPRVVVPLSRSSGAQVDPPRPALAPGATVRLLDPAHMGQIATVRSVPALPRNVESRIRVPAVEVVQEGAEPFLLPRTAVEVIAS
jgi:hypothetical protein